MSGLYVIGVGNVAAADDGAGPAVIEKLRHQPLPENTTVESAGVDALGVIEYLEQDAEVIIVDAVRMGEKPGAILTFPAERAKVKIEADAFSLHGIGLAYALELARRMGLPGRATIVGIEPDTVEPGAEMSAAVSQAIDRAVEAVLELVNSKTGPGAARSKGEKPHGETGADY